MCYVFHRSWIITTKILFKDAENLKFEVWRILSLQFAVQILAVTQCFWHQLITNKPRFNETQNAFNCKKKSLVSFNPTWCQINVISRPDEIFQFLNYLLLNLADFWDWGYCVLCCRPFFREFPGGFLFCFCVFHERIYQFSIISMFIRVQCF